MLSELLYRECLVFEAGSRLLAGVGDQLDLGPDDRIEIIDGAALHRELVAKAGRGAGGSLSLLYRCLAFGFAIALAVPLLAVMRLSLNIIKKPGFNPREMPPASPADVFGVLLVITTVVLVLIR